MKRVRVDMIHEKSNLKSLCVRTPLAVLLCVALILALAPSVPGTDGAAFATGFAQDEQQAAASAASPVTAGSTQDEQAAANAASAASPATAGMPTLGRAAGGAIDIFRALKASDASESSDASEPSETSGGDADALATSLGPPLVDAVVSGLPYSDSRTIDDSTHVVTMSAIGTDEMISYRGYVYKINLTKGATYSISMIFDPSETFNCIPVFLDGDSNMSIELLMAGEVFTADTSGTFYLLVTDLGLSKGGRYTLQIEKASRITGKVTDGKGKALSDVTVVYYSEKKSRNNADFMGATWTDPRGRYSIAIKPGRYKILFLPDGSDYNRPRYAAEYYSNKHSVRRAKVVSVGLGKTRSGVNARLAAYSAPKADRKIASLPFKQSSSVGTGSREIHIATDGFLYRAKVYSVRMQEGRSYEFALKGGKGATDPMIWVIDSKGYYAGAFVADTDDKRTAMGSLTPDKTDNYRVIVFDPKALSSFKYTLNISSDFTPGSIAGKVVNRGGHALPYFEALVYKKRGKRWVSYMWAITGTDGKYSVGGLAPGEYKVKFALVEDEGYSAKYYKKGSPGGSKTRSGGSAVSVSEGGTTDGIDIRS
jgi:hypothetical protein